MELVEQSTYIGAVISIASYVLGLWLKEKTHSAWANPLLISLVLVVVFLLCTGTSYESYRQGTQFITYLLTPATVCLAVPLYEQFEALKRNYKAVLSGIIAGTLTSMCCVLLMAVAMGLSHQGYVSLLPKSITTAIGIGISGELGGIVPITVLSIVITGVFGNVIAEQFLRLIHVEEPVARGIAIGTASHAMGTVRAMEMGRVEGAMSGLSIVVAGILTVITASIFAVLH